MSCLFQRCKSGDSQECVLANGAGDEYQWGYDDICGPHSWCAHFKDANGQEQSPIDLKNRDQISQSADCNVSVHYRNCQGTVVNTGHAVKWTPDNGGHILIDDVPYDLIQFHHHCPSEHTFDGKQKPLCFHMVHQQQETQRLAVLGFLFKIDESVEDPFIENIIQTSPHTNQTSTNTLDICSLAVDGEYVHYDGSLTTPPCSEKVLWFVNKRELSISQRQLDWFRSHVAHDTARPVQEMFGRTLSTLNVSANNPME